MKDDDPSALDTLIERARVDAEALGELLKRYEPYLRLVARQQIGRQLAVRCDASDIVQQTLTDAFRAFHSFDGSMEPVFSAWIMRIHQRNLDETVRKHVKAEKRSVRKEHRLENADASASFCWFEPAADQSTPSQHMIEGERALRLAGLIESLPQAQAEAVRLRHLEGWPIGQIAAHLDRSVAATAGLLKRGLSGLREKMNAQSWSFDS